MNPSTEKTDETVRRVLAHELEVSTFEADDFNWIEHETREDAGWILARIQNAFNVQLFADVDEENFNCRWTGS